MAVKDYLLLIHSALWQYIQPTRLLCFTADSQLENEANHKAETPSENMKADMNNCPRDSGCHMPSDSPDTSTEDTDLHFISEYPLPAETTASRE